MATTKLPDRSRYEFYLSKGAPAKSGATYFDIHESDLEAVAEKEDEELIGYIHSAQLGSTVDGPGLRLVTFLTGCLLRCQYCHNPDTWHTKNGKPFSVAQAMHVVRKYVDVLKLSKGGITLSGGEPMVQTQFTGRADVHRRSQPHGLEAAENFDGLRVVLVAALRRHRGGFLVTHVFSPRSNFFARSAALNRPPAIRSEHPRSKKSFCVKQGRRICGLIRASPYPLIPVSLGESGTRKVPAPSHLAQRDVAKTHVSPGG